MYNNSIIVVYFIDYIVNKILYNTVLHYLYITPKQDFIDSLEFYFIKRENFLFNFVQIYLDFIDSFIFPP